MTKLEREILRDVIWKRREKVLKALKYQDAIGVDNTGLKQEYEAITNLISVLKLDYTKSTGW